jgi:hypothetical protein
VEIVLQDQASAAEEQTLGVGTLACCAQQVFFYPPMQIATCVRRASLEPLCCSMASGTAISSTAIDSLTLVELVQVLLTADPKRKAALTHQAWQRFKAGLMPVGQAEPPARPARPLQPQARQSTVQLAGCTFASRLSVVLTAWMCLGFNTASIYQLRLS